MAKAKYITEFERECIRIGARYGATNAAIARFLGRGKMVVGNHRKQMEEVGIMDELPFPFVAEEIGKAILKHEVR